MAEQDRDQRTEAPTPQRIRKAVEEGQIGTSSELIGSVIMAAGVLYFWLAGSWFFTAMAQTIQIRSSYFEQAILFPESLQQIFAADVMRVGGVMLGFLIPLTLVTVLVGGLQTNFNISFKPLELKWDKLSITKGFGRIFSSSSVVRGVMAVLKTGVIVFVAWIITRSQFEEIVCSGTWSIPHMMLMMCRILLYVALSAAAVIALLGVADLAFQKWKHVQNLRMSMRDIRDEYKESEGDPLIRARVKRLQAELATRRMVQEVSRASALITNPTHFAVAVEYDRTKMLAPRVTAKGKDHMAKKMIEIAGEHGVPIVERKPIARFLYFNVKRGQSIPHELYEAVAEVLNFISRMRLDRR